MPRRKTLTDAAIASLAPSTRPYPDPELAGHYIRVRPTGTKTFVAVARTLAGKQKWVTIGTSGLFTIKEAREKARDAIKAIRDGKSTAGPKSFETVAEEWFTRYVTAKGLISASEIRSYLDRQLIPAWRGRDFNSIRRGEIAELLDKIADVNGPGAADNVLAVISRICNWYVRRNENYSSPVVKGMKRLSPKERARARILNDSEIREVWRIAEANGTFGAFVRVALLTGQRREKVATMRWQDISEDGEWIIPSKAREKGTAGSLILPKAALDIINSQPRLASNEYVFAGAGSSPMQCFSKRKAAFDAKLNSVTPWTIHDLRRTARSLLARAGIASEHGERVLGHAIRGVEGVYNHHAYDAEKARALAALAQLIESILRTDDANQKVRRLRG